MARVGPLALQPGPLGRWLDQRLLAGSPGAHGLTGAEARGAGLPAQPMQMGTYAPGDGLLYGLGTAATAGVAKYAMENPPPPPNPDRKPAEWEPLWTTRMLRRGVEGALGAYRLWRQPTEAHSDAQPMGEAFREAGEQAKAAGKLLGVETATGIHQLGGLMAAPGLMLEGQDFNDAMVEGITGLPGGEWAYNALEKAKADYREAGGTGWGELALGVAAPLGAGDIAAIGGLVRPMVIGVGGKAMTGRPLRMAPEVIKALEPFDLAAGVRKITTPEGIAEMTRRHGPPSAVPVGDDLRAVFKGESPKVWVDEESGKAVAIHVPPERTAADLLTAQPVRALKAKSEQGLPIRTMTPEDALAHAHTGAHLRKGAKGAWVGAPRGVNAPRYLKKMRAGYDKYVEVGMAGAPWYKRSRAGFEEVAAPGQTGVLARDMAVTSPGARMPTNTNWGVGVHNALATGTPPPSLRFHAREWPLLQQRQGALSMKTEPFRQNLTVGEPYAPGGVHDVWDLAAWGYKNSKGEPLKGASETQHRFMDAETVLAVERANINKLGGRSDWTADEVQASAWVGFRALENPRYKRGEITIEQAVDEAKLDYSDYMQDQVVHVTYEHTPYGGSGHRPEIASWPIEKQREYAEQAGLIDPVTKHDLLYDEVGIPQYPSTGAVGSWVDPATGKVEQNWSTVLRVLAAHESGKVGDITAGSRAALDAIETFRGWFLGQGMSGYHKAFPVGGRNQPKLSEATGVLMQSGRDLTQPEMSTLARQATQHGYGGNTGYVAGRGGGETVMTEFGPKGGALAGEEIEGGLTKAGVPGFGEQPVKVVGPGSDPVRDVPIPSYWKEWAEDPQKSAVTKHMLDVVLNQPVIADKIFNSQKLKMAAQAILARDAGATNVNPRWLEGLRIFAESDNVAADLQAAVMRGGEVAMVALTIGGLLAKLSGEDEGGNL